MLVAAITEIYDANPNIVTVLGGLTLLCLFTGLLQPAAKPKAAKALVAPKGFKSFQWAL